MILTYCECHINNTVSWKSFVKKSSHIRTKNVVRVELKKAYVISIELYVCGHIYNNEIKF